MLCGSRMYRHMGREMYIPTLSPSLFYLVSLGVGYKFNPTIKNLLLLL